VNERDATLRGQLLRWLLIPLSLLLLVDAAGSYVLATRLAARVYDAEILEIARELALHVHAQGAGAVFDLEADAERTLLLDQVDTIHYEVRDAAGARIAGDTTLPPAPGGPGFRDAQLDDEPVRIARLVAAVDGKPVEVDVASTERKRSALAREIVGEVIVPQLLLILVAGALVYLGVTRGLAPLATLRAAIAARSHRDLSPVVVPRVPGEVQPLVAAINDLMARLDEVLGLQSRFVADAAHELRTPVAGMKAHIELALREEDPQELKRSLAHVYVGVERMSHLVAQLLSLARNEPIAVRKLEAAPVDLARLAFDVTGEWVAQAWRRRIDLGFEGARDAVMVEGDARRLTELLNNLVDNAIRYSRDGGRVTVRVGSAPTPRVSISDDGPTIPVPERERVFERFHRMLGTRADGSGLGLAIVREIATLHGATIALDDDVDGVGNTFTVAFPATAAPLAATAS
jgi:two-component system, OmpR family, sensor histidine kinase TctE